MMAEEEGEYESVIAALNERLERHDNNRREVQESLHNACDRLRKQIDEMEEDINSRFGEEFSKEENRLQGALNELRKYMSEEEKKTAKLSKAINDAMAELLVIQTYELVECDSKDKEEKGRGGGISKRFELKTEKQTTLEWIRLRTPIIVSVAETDRGYVQVDMIEWRPREDTIIEVKNIFNEFRYKAFISKEGNEEEEEKGSEYALIKHNNEDGKTTFSIKTGTLEPGTTYRIKVRITWNDKESEWSDFSEFKTLEFPGCVWKDCPDYVFNNFKYSVNESNQRIATKVGEWNQFSTIIGSRVLPTSTVTSWSVSVTKSKYNDGNKIYIGVAPSDVDQNRNDNLKICGWYFDCYYSALCSGPPHNYNCKEYGPKKIEGSYVRTGNTVGIVMDTTKGELSFFVNGVNCGVAYEGIPLDKPLMPCVLLGYEGDSVELDTSEVKETSVDPTITVPTNITGTGSSWDVIILSWDPIRDASFYQVEVDGSKFIDGHNKNAYSKRGLLQGTEHSFRVRTVKRNSVSEWSSVAKVKTREAPDFSECIWRECPTNADEKARYILGKFRTRVVTKVSGDGYCTVIGNAPVPINSVIPWNIKVLKSKYNDGGNILVGVAPSDIDQNDVDNQKKCGWYFNCYASALWSGFPHNYGGTAYGPRKAYGQYVHTKDTIGIVMNTIKGELSFILNNKYLGVAYEGVPLDKPLIPCVFLYYEGDSVELKTKKVEQEILF